MVVQKRYIKIGIPMDDISVLKWLEKQHNMSDSLRHLIKEDVERGGYSDVFCREVVPKSKVGRKSNAELLMEREALEQQVDIEPVRNTVPVQPKTTTTPKKAIQTMQTKAAPKPQPKPVYTQPVVEEDDFIDPEALLGL